MNDDLTNALFGEEADRIEAAAQAVVAAGTGEEQVAALGVLRDAVDRTDDLLRTARDFERRRIAGEVPRAGLGEVWYASEAVTLVGPLLALIDTLTAERDEMDSVKCLNCKGSKMGTWAAKPCALCNGAGVLWRVRGGGE